MTGWAPSHDLTTVILASARPRRYAGWGRRLRTLLLVAAAAGQLVLTVPLLSDAAGGGMAMDMHGMHELGVFDFALAVAFLVGAIRPRLAGGLAWPCCAAAFGLVATSTLDIISHHTFEAHEARHLIAVGGAILLCLAARDTRSPEPDSVLAQPIKLRSGHGQGVQGWHLADLPRSGDASADNADSPAVAASAAEGGAA